MLRLILIFGFFTVASTSASGQLPGRHYWTKTVLATDATCKLRIGDGVLSPGEKECTYSGHLAANTKLLLKSVKASGRWGRVELTDESDTWFTLEISHRSKASFEQIFREFFADQSSDDYEPTCDGKVLKDFLFSVGFPDQLSRRKNGEEWHLSANHLSVQMCGFDIARLKFVGGKLEGLTGSI